MCANPGEEYTYDSDIVGHSRCAYTADAPRFSSNKRTVVAPVSILGKCRVNIVLYRELIITRELAYNRFTLTLLQSIGCEPILTLHSQALSCLS